MKTFLVTIALGAAMLTTQACAQPAAPVGGGHHGWAQDMTRQQAQQFADSMFQRLDTNHDGVLTRAEADAAASQDGGRGGRMIDRLFGDAQSVTLAQAEAAALARFDAQDLNHDGVVSAAEREQARAQRQGGQ